MYNQLRCVCDQLTDRPTNLTLQELKVVDSIAVSSTYFLICRIKVVCLIIVNDNFFCWISTLEANLYIICLKKFYHNTRHGCPICCCLVIFRNCLFVIYIPNFRLSVQILLFQQRKYYYKHRNLRVSMMK